MNKIYFVGGAKGVGKTTLLNEVSTLTRLMVVNTGDFFSNDESRGIVTQRIINSLVEHSPLIASTHYAGFIGNIFSRKFERGLSISELQGLATSADLELILIDLDEETLHQRRCADLEHVRDKRHASIRAELEYNRRYFHEYCTQLNKEGKIIFNYSFRDSLYQLLEIVLPQKGAPLPAELPN